MQTTTSLLRQVHPQWLKDGKVLSLAFRPFPKDAGLLIENSVISILETTF